MVINNTVQHYRQGFSLIEALVATAVFAIVMMVVLDIFIQFVKDPEKDVEQQELQEQMSYFSSFLAFEMRHAVIDYAAYDGTTPCGSLPAVGTPTSVLCIIGNTPVQVYLDTHPDTGLPDMLFFEEAGNKVQLLSSAVAVNKVEFFLYPNGDAFDSATGLNNQPSVLIVIEARSTKSEEVEPIQYQTFVTLREYAR